MPWEEIFRAANTYALISWLILVVAPGREKVLTLLFYFGSGLLALTYAGLIIPLMTGWIDPGAIAGAKDTPANFTTLPGVMALFDTRGGATIGWIHYLAFDLFVGIWIARDADRRGMNRILQVPVLLLVFLFGPMGLLLYIILRQIVGQKSENPIVSN